MKALLFAMMLALAACTTVVPVAAPGATAPAVSNQYTQEIEYACAGAAAALKVLTVANNAGKLTPAQQTQIISAAGATTPVCGAPEAPTLSNASYKAFLAAVALLQSKANPFTTGN